MTKEKLVPFHEVVPSALKPLVFHFKGEKADFSFGATVTLLGLIQKTFIPKEHMPEIIKACDFVDQALKLLNDEEIPEGLRNASRDTLEELRKRVDE